jgi:hypothetical protein
MGAVSAAKAGVGSAVNDATRITGATLGVAVVGSIYASIYSSRLADALPAGIPGSFFDGFQIAVLVAVAITLIGAVAAAILIPNQPPETACIEIDEAALARAS